MTGQGSAELTTQTFNSDLLIRPSDRTLAKQAFPQLYPYLDFPQLRDLFARHESDARRAKTFRRFVGLTAILLGTVALLGASASPLYFDSPDPWPSLLGGSFALLGILSALLGGLGVFNTTVKRRWLCNRLMAERLRQLHFQILINQISHIASSDRTQDSAETALHERTRHLAAFMADYQGHLVGKLAAIVDTHTDEEAWLLTEEPELSPTLKENSAARELWQAYEIFRINHQMQFASSNMKDDDPRSPLFQQRALTTIILTCICLIFLAHLAVSSSLLWKPTIDLHSPLLNVALLWTAIVALAARAFEEGLQPSRESERYRRNRSVLEHLMVRFKAAKTPKEKVDVMREIELVVFRELRSFLKTNNDASFAL